MLSFFKRHKVLTSVLVGYSTLYIGLQWIKPFLNRFPSGFTSRTTAEEIAHHAKLDNTVAVVTGASGGIGEETARVLHMHGAHLILTGRNLSKLEQVRKNLMSRNPKAKIDVFQLDLGSSESVNTFVTDFKNLNLPLNLLILNAGVLSDQFEKNQDGFELQFGSNLLGNFRLTNLLLPIMSQSPNEKRIVVLSSKMHEQIPQINWKDLNMEESPKGYLPRYSHSKLALIMFAKELNRKLIKDKVDITVNAVHPGLITTGISRDLSLKTQIIEFLATPFMLLINKNIQQGASTTIYAALSPDLKGIGGQYLNDNRVDKASPYTDNEEECQKLWDLSEKMTGVHYNLNNSYKV